MDQFGGGGDGERGLSEMGEMGWGVVRHLGQGR